MLKKLARELATRRFTEIPQSNVLTASFFIFCNNRLLCHNKNSIIFTEQYNKLKAIKSLTRSTVLTIRLTALTRNAGNFNDVNILYTVQLFSLIFGYSLQ